MTKTMMDCSETCLTTLFMLAGVLLAAWAVWSENRWRKEHKIPIVPTTPVMFIGVLAALLALVHLMTLAGIQRP